MRRFAMLLCVFILAVFIGVGIINSDSDPPCAELTEIVLNQMPAELSRNSPNPFNATDENFVTIIETGLYEIAFSASVPIGGIMYGIIPDETQITGFSTKEYESALGEIYFSKASQTGVISQIMDAGQNPKDIVVGSIDSFIYTGELDVTVAAQVAYPLIA